MSTLYTIQSGEQYAIRKQLNNGSTGTIDELEIKNNGNLEGIWSYNDGILTIDHIKSTKDKKQEFYNVNKNNIDTEGTKVGDVVVYNTPDKDYYVIKIDDSDVVCNLDTGHSHGTCDIDLGSSKIQVVNIIE